MKSSVAFLAILPALALCLACSPRDPVRPYVGEPGPPFVPDLDTEPVWSNTGQWIAYRRRFPSADGQAGLYLIPPAGGKPRLLLEGGFWYPTRFRFSPDDRYIICQMMDQLLLIDVATGSATQPFYSPHGAAEPNWSPDGRSIVYWRMYNSYGVPPESVGVHIFNLDTGRDSSFTFEGRMQFGASPLWSPDGQEIAMTQWDTDHLEIVAFKTDGSAMREVVAAPSGRGLGSLLRSFVMRSLGVHGIGFGGSTVLGEGHFFVNWDGTGLARQPRHYLQIREDWFSPDGSMCVGPRYDPLDSLVVLFVFRSDDITGATARQITRYAPPQGQMALWPQELHSREETCHEVPRWLSRRHAAHRGGGRRRKA